MRYTRGQGRLLLEDLTSPPLLPIPPPFLPRQCLARTPTGKMRPASWPSASLGHHLRLAMPPSPALASRGTPADDALAAGSAPSSSSPAAPGAEARPQSPRDAGLTYEALLTLDEGNVKRGLSDLELRSLKRRTAGPGDSKEACGICLAAYAPRAPLLACPCGHAFHEECVTQWLSQNRSCPTCRYKFPG